MKIAIDISPLKTGNYLSHRVRGTGFYLTNLLESLKKYYPENEYVEFVRGRSLPSEIDVVHYPYFEPFFLTLPRKMPKKSIVTVHDLTPFVFPKNFPAGLKGNLKWRLQKRSLKNAAAIITDSEASKKDIVRFAEISDQKIHVVYLAPAVHFKKLTSRDWKEKLSKKYDLPDRFMLYVGDATWNKNLPNMIKAIIDSGTQLVIVGKAFVNTDIDKSNPWTDDLVEAQELARNNLNIKSLGFVPDEDLVFLYNLATALLMPSRYEGFGLPIVEAMQSGCPIVTSKKGSIGEVVGDASVFVEPEDVGSIKEGILKVWNDEKLRDSLREKGLERAKFFDWQKTAEQTIKVYEKI